MYFETIKCEDFEVYNLDYHHKRVARTIGKNLNLQEYINPQTNELLRCKLVYDDNEILNVEYFTYKKREFKNFKIIFDDNIDYSKKYLNRDTLDKLYEKREDCDDIIIIKDEIVTDTSIANIAILYDDIWITSKNCLLEGTTRARLIEDKKIIEKDISLDMLYKAKKIAIFNAMLDFIELNDYSFKL